MTFNIAELTPMRVTQTDAVLVSAECFSQGRIELYWKLKRKISNKVQDNYGGIFTPPAAAAEGGLMFYLCFNFDIVKIFLTIPVAQISQNLPEPSLPNLQEW